MDYEIFLEDEESGLLVSNLGRVVGPTGKILKPMMNRGYGSVRFNKTRQIKVHRLVARNFLLNTLGLPIVNHRDENPGNNRVDNLEWCTIKYNNSYGTARERRQLTANRNRSSSAEKPVTLQKCGQTKHFKSIRDAIRTIGVNPARIISGKSKSCKGWHLPGVEADRPFMHISHKKDSHGVRRVFFSNKEKYVFSNGEETRTFESLSEASSCLGVDGTALCRVANSKKNSVNGWHLPGGCVKKSYPIEVTLTNGVEKKDFKTLHDAARFLHTDSGNISRLVSGKRKQLNGWFVDGKIPSAHKGKRIIARKDSKEFRFNSISEASKRLSIPTWKLKFSKGIDFKSVDGYEFKREES